MRPRFAHLNLRYNPFGELDRAERARLALVDPLPLGPGDRVQLVGDSGRGKTTHLLALQARHPGAVYELVPERADRFVSRPTADVLFLLDEAQRVRQGFLKALFRRPGPVVLGTHEDLSRIAPMRTLRLAGLGAERLSAMAETRIEAARRGSGPVPRLPLEQARRLVARFGDDVRAIEWHLYDVFQELAGPVDVQV
jgi:hypothetical protein